MKKVSMAKRIIACVCSVAMAGALVPAVAAASDGGSTAEDTALTVKYQKVDEQGNKIGIELTKTYTMSQLQTMTTNTTESFLYSGKGRVTKVTSSEVVEFYTIMQDVVGDNYSDVSIAVKSGSDGSTGKYKFDYDDVTLSKFYFPNYVNNSESDINTADSEYVWAGLALSAKKATVESDQVAKDVEATETVTDVPMTVDGSKDGELQAGSHFWTGINELDITYVAPAMRIVDSATQDVLKTYSTSDLESLANKNTSTVSYQYAGKGKFTKVTSSNYVTFSQLLEGVSSWKAGSTATMAAGGDMNTKHTYTYEELTNPGYYFPNAANNSESLNTTGAVEVPAALALSYSKGSVEKDSTFNDTTVTPTEGSVVVMGTTKDATSLNAGNIFWTNVDTIYVTAGATPSVQPSTTVTKKANTLKVGKTKVKVKKGKTAKIAVKKAKGKVTVKVNKKKIAKVTYKKKTGKIIIKGLKKGKAKITVTAKGNANYKSGKKTITVTVK